MAQPASAVDPRFVARERQPGLDGLRALAVTLVVCYHAGNFGLTLPSDAQRFGWVGVDLFFVLSGYLIGGQLFAPLSRGQTVDLPRFFWRRALRILPAYGVVLAVYVAFPSWREWPRMPPLWKFLAFVQNLGLHGGTAFSHAWSLCVEGQFYLVLPFLLGWLVPRRNAGGWMAVGVVIGGLLLRGVIGYLHPSPAGGVSGRAFQTLGYYATWTRLDPLVCGVGLSGIQRFRPRWWQVLTKAAPWLLLPALATIGFGLYLSEGQGFTLTACIWQFPVIALGLAGLLICAVSERLPFRRVAIPGAGFLASVAYSVYLSHKLVIHWTLGFCAAHGLPLTSPAALGLNLLLIGLVGSALFFAVERPFLQLRRQAVPPRPAGKC